VVRGGAEVNPVSADVLGVFKECRDLLPPYITTEKEAWEHMASLSSEDFPCDPTNEATATNNSNSD
jgi:hypothetical protein